MNPLPDEVDVKDDPRRHGIGKRHEIVEKSVPMDECSKCPAHRLMKQQVVQINAASFRIDHKEPDGRKSEENAPSGPSEISFYFFASFFDQKEEEDGEKRNEKPERTFGKEGKENI